MAETRIVKDIVVNVDKCIGCRACELACSTYHAEPKYSSTNPDKARIRVVIDELRDIYVPVRAREYTAAECNGRNTYVIEGKEYSECSFCGAPCPSRNLFMNPDTGLPLTCDLCESDPPLDEPICVQVCRCDALVYEEREEPVSTEEEKKEEIAVSLNSLAGKYGFDAVLDALARISVSRRE